MRFKKLLIWFLIILIAIGYNFAIRQPENKNQLVKITPQKTTFRATESPRFVVEIPSSKSLRRFFRLTLLSFWPVARAEEESNVIARSDSDEVMPTADLPQVDNLNTNNDGITIPPEVAPQDDDLAQVVTSTDFVIEIPNPQVLGEIIASEATVTQTSTPLITPITPISPITLITTTSSTTDTSLLSQALEKVGDLIEKVQEVASDTLGAEPQVEVKVYDPTGEESEAKVEIEEIQDNQYEIALDDQGQKLPRGDYEMVVAVEQGVLQETQRQSFNWGGREIPELRNYTSKTYDNLDGTYTMEAHIGQIHYQNEQTNALEEIDTTLIDQGSQWQMEKASYHAQIPQYADEPMVFQDVFGDKNQIVTMIPQAQHSEGEMENTDGWENQRVRYKNAFGEGIDLRVTVGNIGLFKEIIVKQKPENLNQDLAFDFELILSENQAIYSLNNETQELKKLENLDNFELAGNEQLLIGPPSPNPPNFPDSPDSFSYIRQIRVWDSAGNTVSGKLRFYQKDGQLYFQKIIPQDFLEKATYPVYTDDTSTFYGDAANEVDGYVACTAGAGAWNTCRSAATGWIADSTAATFLTNGGWNSSANAYRIYRVFLPLDTSLLPNSASISAATLYLWDAGTANAGWSNALILTTQDTTQLTTADFDALTLNSPSEGASRLTSYNVDAYTSWALNSTGIGWISLTDVTKLGIRDGTYDVGGTIPTDQNQKNWYSSEQTGTGNDPYLSVTYIWGITVSGTIYTDEGSTAYNCSTNNLTVALKVNGAGTYSATCTASTGTYSINQVGVSAAADVITVFLDGETEKAVTVTRAADTTSNITGLNLYQNRLIVRHEDAGPVTNANLGQYDKDQDTDIHFTSNSNALTVDNDTELHLWTGKTFSPGGTVTTSPGGTLGDVHIDDSATFTAGGAISVGGSWTADSSTTFTPGSYGVTFTATATGKTITPDSSSFYSLTFNGSGGGWTFQANATTTDNFTITAGTVTGPSSGHIAVGGNWANNGGTFTPNSSEVKFNASAIGKTLSSSGTGNLIFYDTDFNSSSGGWTASNNATSTNNWKLTSGTFTASSGVHLEVDGQFSNATGGANTTWTSDSVLFLNSGTNYTINTKTTGSDIYSYLEIGANTDIRMWNSSASNYSISSSGSLYSMDHGASDGVLVIRGDYHVPPGSTDYWNYADDFDGTASANRTVQVGIANGSTVNVDSATTLQIIGTNTATTTISYVTAEGGSYGFNVASGATLNARYYKFQRLNATGLNLLGGTITNLANGEFDNSGGSGASDTFITVAGDVITNNPASTFSKCNFNDTNGNAEYNVTATGSTASYWTFSTSYGAFDGEANDLDPGGDPGYIRWDDSTSGTLSETASSSATFASVTYSFTSQNDTGNLMGAVYISDSRGAAPGWDLNVTSADWSRTGGGSMDYDGDGSSTGQLCLVLSGAAIYAISGSMTGVTKGSDDCFDSVTTQIQIADATVGNGVGTYWLVDQTMSQFIPAMQQAGTYTASLSIVAS